MKNKLFCFMATVFLLLASVTSASACFISQYQPEVPETLRK